MTAKNKSPRDAFTLLELLLAISLLGMISVFIYGWLLQSSRQITHTQAALQTQRHLFSAIQLIKHDLLQKTTCQLTDKHTLSIQTYFHSAADPDGIIAVRYQCSEQGIYRQVNQEPARFVCSGADYEFTEKDTIITLQLDPETSVRLSP